VFPVKYELNLFILCGRKQNALRKLENTTPPSSGDEREAPTLFAPLDRGLLFRKDTTEQVPPSLHPKTEADAASETLCLPIPRTPSDGQSPETN
jgi:hypothetical protein